MRVPMSLTAWLLFLNSIQHLHLNNNTKTLRRPITRGLRSQPSAILGR